MGAGGNKLFLPLQGIPILYYTLSQLNSLPAVTRIFPVIREDEAGDLAAMLEAHGALQKLMPPVWGGKERSDSVRNGLTRVLSDPGSPVVMVHDGARPFVDQAMLERLEKAAQAACALPVLPVADTTRQLDGPLELPTTGDQSTRVIDRGHLALTQTPQAFPVKWIEQVFFTDQAKRAQLTDEGSYFEAAGLPVVLVLGAKGNLKLTHPEDLALAEALFSLQKNKE